MTDTFSKLFIFELANNHQGDVSHGKRIIDRIGALASKYRLNGALKFQFRDLDTFIHPAHREFPNKHIRRFMDTRLSESQFSELARHAKSAGLIPMATVFDEASLPLFERLEMKIL